MTKQMAKPTVFVGSSGEGLDIARGVQSILEDGTWRSKVFDLGGNPGDRRKFGAFLVGKAGITKLTPDIVECATVEVVLGE
jgi:hypothetical protein